MRRWLSDNPRLRPINRPTPRTADGKPDLNGCGVPIATFIYDISSALKKGETVPLQPWAEEVTKERMSKDDPEANCLPGRRAAHGSLSLEDRADSPRSIVFLFEGNIHTYRQIFMDGRGHPADPDPTWYGHSIGKWEGDTLVVDTVGFNDKFWFDFAAHPHTEKLHITERYRRPDYSHLDFEVVIDDPGAYTRPFTMYGHSPLVENSRNHGIHLQREQPGRQPHRRQRYPQVVWPRPESSWRSWKARRAT